MIINAGITRVIYEGDYPDEFSKELFHYAKLEVLRYRDGALEPVDLTVTIARTKPSVGPDCSHV